MDSERFYSVYENVSSERFWLILPGPTPQIKKTLGIPENRKVMLITEDLSICLGGVTNMVSLEEYERVKQTFSFVCNMRYREYIDAYQEELAILHNFKREASYKDGSPAHNNQETIETKSGFQIRIARHE